MPTREKCEKKSLNDIQNEPSSASTNPSFSLRAAVQFTVSLSPQSPCHSYLLHPAAQTADWNAVEAPSGHTLAACKRGRAALVGRCELTCPMGFGAG